MSKIIIREEIEIRCSSEKEVKTIRDEMRKKGFHSQSADVPYFSYQYQKYCLTMYTKFKKYKP